MQTHTSNKIAAPTTTAFFAQSAARPVHAQDQRAHLAPEIDAQLGAAAQGYSFADVGVTPLPLGAIQPKPTVGVPSYTAEKAAAEPAARVVDTEASDETTSESHLQVAPLPLPGGRHHAVLLEENGQLRLGMRSEFTTVDEMAETLLDPSSPLKPDQRTVVQKVGDKVRELETTLQALKKNYDDLKQQVIAKKQEARVPVINSYGPTRFQINMNSPAYKEYNKLVGKVGTAWTEYFDFQTDAVVFAKEMIIALWDIGSDFLPTHLMPAGEIFRDKAFTGDPNRYTYHTGANDDPIPILWYKRPEDYPSLLLSDGKTEVKFGEQFSVSGTIFHLDAANRPKVGWLLQKVSHNESREGQQALNRLLIDNDVAVKKAGNFVKPPLGDRHQFDGDHVRDLGFGGADRASNYWPLDSTINRRAFTGYNAHYMLNYRDPTKNSHHARAIGGLIGKWFIVKGFMNPNDPAAPDEGSAAGGTVKG